VVNRQSAQAAVTSDLTDLQAVLAGRAHVLLDFDGPVCRVYGGIPAHEVAKQLREQVRAELGLSLPEDTDDPLEVLREVHATAADSSVQAHHMLTALEMAAVRSARATPGADELIAAARSTGRTVTVVSNNSADAISLYCLDQGLGDQVSLVVGRDPDVALMKPDPHLINVALAGLGARPDESVFVGDSVTDVAAGHLAGVPVIGFANQPGKAARLSECGADAVTGTLLHISRELVETKA
jgi:HAD superfamily hydrolase (TIGR01509 family)